MAAIIFPASTETSAPRYQPHLPLDQPTRPARRRPGHLRLIEGGRNARSMAKVYRRRQVVAAVLATLVVVFAVVGVSRIMDAVIDTSAPTATSPVTATSADAGQVIVVQQGETLTSIARRLQPTGSTAALVDRLAAAHGPGPLLAGDRLAIASVTP